VRFDSHTHAWNAWPYRNPIKPSSGEALLRAMDEEGIGKSLIVCADIDPSRANNEYVAHVVRQHPDRLAYVVDADSRWSRSHHTGGAVARLERLLAAFPDAVGVAHYVRESRVDAWFDTAEARAWLGLLASSHCVLSLSAGPAWARVVRGIAELNQDLTILWHHLALLHVSDRGLFDEVAAVAQTPNVLLKLSGFPYLSAHPTGAPWADVRPMIDAIYATFGADRLCWGSDFPASLRYSNHRTNIAAAADWLRLLDSRERAAIAGGTLEAILAQAGPPPPRGLDRSPPT
jgi:L-fuconolactonase